MISVLGFGQMYNGGIEYRGGFVSRALGVDRVLNRENDLAMFRADGIPESHPLIAKAEMALLNAELACMVRILGLFSPFAAGVIVTLAH